MSAFLIGWIAATPGYAAPLLLAAIGLIVCEKAGVLNLGAEGLMIVGALAGALTVMAGAPAWTGLVAGALAGLALSLVFALAVVVLRADQTLAGLAIVAVGIGVAGIVGRPYVQKPFAGIERFGTPGPDASAIEVFLLRQDIGIVIAVIMVAASAFWLMRTRAGLRLRAVGEDPSAADNAGIDVQLVQTGAIAFSGVMCGLAGAYLSVIASHVFVEGMVAGRGWIAVALVIFAAWRPWRALLGALVFGGADALGPRLQSIGADVPVYLVMMLPYALTLLVLVLASVRRQHDAAAPSALGRIHIRHDKT
jgi:ABC-type uncharacterized transport system permease subunit